MAILATVMEMFSYLKDVYENKVVKWEEQMFTQHPMGNLAIIFMHL